MPNTEKKITESWKTHQEFLKAIARFRDEITMRGSEVWFGPVCFGSPDQPGVRVPLDRDSAALVDGAVKRVEGLVVGVTTTLQRTVQTTRDAMQQLRTEGVVDETDLARLLERNRGLEELLEQLTRAADISPLACHPARLNRWYELLTEGFGPGNPAVEVRVVTTHVL